MAQNGTNSGFFSNETLNGYKFFQIFLHFGNHTSHPACRTKRVSVACVAGAWK